MYAFYDSAYRLSILICGYFLTFCFTGGYKTPLPVQTSEMSFYNAEIIKESKIRIGFFINFEAGRRTYCIECKNSWIDKQGTHFNATDKENVIQQFEESLTELKTS